MRSRALSNLDAFSFARARAQVVAGLGRARYEQLFAGVKFASHGGLPGTTGKLNKWCKKLVEVLQADGGGGGGGGAAVRGRRQPAGGRHGLLRLGRRGGGGEPG